MSYLPRLDVNAAATCAAAEALPIPQRKISYELRVLPARDTVSTMLRFSRRLGVITSMFMQGIYCGLTEQYLDVFVHRLVGLVDGVQGRVAALYLIEAHDILPALYREYVFVYAFQRLAYLLGLDVSCRG